MSTMMGVPTTYQRLAELASFGRCDLSSLRRVIVGVAAMPTDLATHPGPVGCPYGYVDVELHDSATGQLVRAGSAFVSGTSLVMDEEWTAR